METGCRRSRLKVTDWNKSNSLADSDVVSGAQSCKRKMLKTEHIFLYKKNQVDSVILDYTLIKLANLDVTK